MNHEAKGQMATKSDLDNLKEYLDVNLESKLDSKTFFITAAAQLIITIGALIGMVH
jgi:hypothetical protein